MKGYPREEIVEAKKLVSSFIRSAEEVEEVKSLFVTDNNLIMGRSPWSPGENLAIG